MTCIYPMENPIQNYAWGSRTALPDLMGIPSTGEAQAELWMGAHPKAPSRVRIGETWAPLVDLIARRPTELLGPAVAQRFDSRLPYLLKILAVASPLSIQAHPDAARARRGFDRENQAGLALNDPQRNYRDPHHKPECICALTPFWALNGFRKIETIRLLLGRVCPDSLKDGTILLPDAESPDGLRLFFHCLMTLPPEKRRGLLAEALAHAAFWRDQSPIFDWMIRLNDAYPSDIGVLSPLFLNLLCLEPNQAMFLPAGRLHAYLEGLGVELMANSDNVLRGGLTPKHMDVPELIEALSFHGGEEPILTPMPVSPEESRFATPAEEFSLSVISLTAAPVTIAVTGPEILFCAAGGLAILKSLESEALDLRQGQSIFIGHCARRYTLQGTGTVYRASAPLRPESAFA